MSGIEKKPDFEMFRATLTKLERLIGVCTKKVVKFYYGYSNSESTANPTGESMIHMLKLLIEFDINTTESNAIEELERLSFIGIKILGIPLRDGGPTLARYCASKNPKISTSGLLQQLTESKIAFLKGMPFSRLVSEGDIEPMTALERLTDIQVELRSFELSKLLTSRMDEVVYFCEAKASVKVIPIIWVRPHSYTAAIDPIRHRPLAQRGGFRPCKSILSAPCENPY